MVSQYGEICIFLPLIDPSILPRVQEHLCSLHSISIAFFLIMDQGPLFFSLFGKKILKIEDSTENNQIKALEQCCPTELYGEMGMF